MMSQRRDVTFTNTASGSVFVDEINIILWTNIGFLNRSKFNAYIKICKSSYPFSNYVISYFSDL